MQDPSVLTAALRAKTDELQAKLLAKVEANLSGAVLQERTGALKASIRADVTADATSIAASVSSEGVPYAAILEYGGTTAAHLIEPVKARALAVAGIGGPVFTRVRHPGSRIAAHAYLGSALDALRDEIFGGLKAAVLDALAA